MIQHRIKEREPQYMDMKEIIAEAARKLILEKKVKKLTVKDIVEECQITRQAFYYHFEGIPDLIQWSIKQGTRRLLEACKEQGGAEAALKYLFVFAINAIPEVRKGIESNYGKELEQTLMQGTYELFESIVEEKNLYQNYSRQELKLILRYHSHAIFGIFQDWTPEDTKNLDMIVHEVYLIICKKLKKKPLVINEKIRRKSTLIKYIILATIVITCFCGVYLKTKGWSPWEVFSMLLAGNISLSTYVPAIIILLLIIVGMAVCERFFCRFLCPMGAVFSLLPILPFFSLGREREKCIKGCRACINKCPSDIELPELGTDIQSGDCFMCQKCIDICPKSNVRTSVKKLRGNESMFTLIKVILLIILMKYAGV